jgi:GrpB-like predicted nucleotidyltransferase (UPF0157 family)
VPGREAFHRPDGTSDHHVHAGVAGHERLRDHPALRDHLRGDPEAARAYGVLKKPPAARFGDDVEGGIDGKTAFIPEVPARMGFSIDQVAGIRAITRRPHRAG